jgi:hypothetical protein
MRYSRTGIIAVLLAAEAFIAGAIFWALGVHSGYGFSAQASGLHRVDAGGKTFAAIDAGDSPHVVISDSDSHVVVTTSSDGEVHVTDASHENGWYWGDAARPPLQVARTSDGVSITRAEGHGVRFQFFGFSQDRVEIALPAGSLLDVRGCSGADVTGLTGEVRVHSVDGHIAARDIHTQTLAMQSDDGRLQLDNVDAENINATTHDGSIHAKGLRVRGGTLSSDDGSITVALASDVNLAVRAHTSDGRLTFDGRRADRGEDDSSTGHYQIGSGGSPLEVSTQDGSIHITTNGAQ